MFTKILLGFAIAALVRASRGNVSASALNTSYTFDHQNGTQPTALHVTDGLEVTTISRRLIPSDSEIINIEYYEDENIDALWLPFKKLSPTVLMLNDNTICGASDHAARFEGYEQQAVQLRSKFKVNVLMVYYRGYVA